MSGAVKKSLHPSIDPSRREAAGIKKRKNFLVNLFTVDSVTNHIEADLLAGLNRGVNLFEFFRRAPAHDGPAQVAEVAGSLRPRENVEDYRGVRFDGAGAFVVRVDALVAGGNNRVAGKPSLRHDGRVDDGLQRFRGQAAAVEMEIAVAADFGSFKCPDAGLKPKSRDPKRF